MKIIWKIVKQQKWEDKTKQYVFVLFITGICCLIGAASWLLIGNRLLSDSLYMIAFIGYPGVAGLIGSTIYLFNHSPD